MTIRYDANSQTTFGVAGLPSGYDGKSASSFTIPSVGIVDADRAFFMLLDKEIRFETTTSNTVRQVPVVFASGEKWALLKRKKGLRDKSNMLILPLITVVRTTIQQSLEEDVTGRGINQQTGEIFIKRRLDQTDRQYQNLINRYLVPHQTTLASPALSADVDQTSTTRTTGDLSEDPTVQDGGLLLTDKRHNIFETLVVPAPQFYTAMYEVTLWAQYNEQMSQMLEQVFSSFLPQAQSWKLTTDTGYWFIASVVEGGFESEANVDDFSVEERIIKYKFTVKVPAYILASRVPGTPVPVKRYVSNPSITFDVSLGEDVTPDGIDDPFLGSDDPTLPDSLTTKRSDQRETGKTRLFPQNADITSSSDPALKAFRRGQQPPIYKKFIAIDRFGRQVTKYAKVITINKATGETVFAPGTDLGGLVLEVADD